MRVPLQRLHRPFHVFGSDTKIRISDHIHPCPEMLEHRPVIGLERAGAPQSVAMKLTDHKNESGYLRYAIVSEGDLRDGVAKLAQNMGTVRAQSEAK
jgi:hypothetical protein